MSAATKLLCITALFAVVLTANACSGSGDDARPDGTASATPTRIPAPTPTPTPVNPQVLLDQSGAVMEDLDSFHFQLTHRSGGTELLENMFLQEAEGDVVKPDQISAEFSGTFGGIAIKSGVITLGDDSYMINPLSGKWENVPKEVSPLGFFNPREGIASMMAQVSQPGLVESKNDSYLIEGKLPAEALGPLLGTTVQGAFVSVELRIDAGGSYLLEAVIDGKVTSTEPEGTVRVIKLSRFNEPITITPP